ncbi:MAG: hypothetical protein ABI939_03845, partial [Anaerolineaceae bacterium]
VGVGPSDSSVAIDYATGEVLLTGLADHIPPLALLPRLVVNTCDKQAICFAVWDSPQRPLLAPISGGMSCSESAHTLELVTARYTLHYKRRVEWTGGVTLSDFSCPVAQVARRGDGILFPGQYEISATSPSGDELSVAASRDGDIYIGSFAPVASCPPCRLVP